MQECKKLNMHEDCRGITLVEILLSIAILAILTSVSAYGISLLNSRDSEKCARTIEGKLGSLQSLSRAKEGEWYMEVSKNAGNNELRIYRTAGGVTELQETIGLQNQVNMVFEADGITYAHDMVKIAFDKSSGKVKEAAGRPPCAVLKIKISNKRGSKKADVILISATGKHYVE